MSKRVVVCGSCGKSEFHKAKGLCKRCYDRRNKRDQRKRNPEYFREIDKKRWPKRREKQNAGRIARYYANYEEERNRQKIYREENREKIRAGNRKYQKIRRKIHLKKERARDAVRNAVRRGKIPSPLTLGCLECDKPAYGYHHHKGYSKEHRLDVIPLCHRCHGKTRRKTQLIPSQIVQDTFPKSNSH